MNIETDPIERRDTIILNEKTRRFHEGNFFSTMRYQKTMNETEILKTARYRPGDRVVIPNPMVYPKTLVGYVKKVFAFRGLDEIGVFYQISAMDDEGLQDPRVTIGGGRIAEEDLTLVI